MLEWLLGAAVGPATVALPVNWTAEVLAGAACRWFGKLRHTDDLSLLVRAATDTSVNLTSSEFEALRELLEGQQVWGLLARGTVDELAEQVATCLPPGRRRTLDDSRTASLAVARGLLEFAVADLEPEMFQRVLLARLQRMDTRQATALDQALLAVHSGFGELLNQLKRVLDGLPQGPAGLGEIAVYLRTLIDWLDIDPWPRDFGGPVIDVSAIERKLRATTGDVLGTEDLDADDLTQHCSRLVILGGPGSGKTWLARRTARLCATQALRDLAEGATSDEVELPLFTTCSHLFGVPGNIREAVSSSSLDYLPDMGGGRISTALRELFIERNTATLLVIDSLDETHGPSERLQQAATLPWRIIVTSRPSSWRNQLSIDSNNESQRVATLQALQYPADINSFIERWFAGQPERGHELSLEIARRPSLRQVSTVPLILAFYCIIGNSASLPPFRQELYAMVLKRMLTGRWRDDADRQPDSAACLSILRDWAWLEARKNDPLSGVGKWTDEILTERVQLDHAEAEALDHVAIPLGPPDVDSGKTVRRFVHRAVREHLVAEQVVTLPTDQAADVLLPHLWYDSDWEYVAPAAIAAHTQRDELLRELIGRAAKSGQMPASLSVIDGAWQIREFLARIASESNESDWWPETAQVIADARLELARSGRTSYLRGANWPSSNRELRKVLLDMLAEHEHDQDAAWLADTLMCLAPTTEELRYAQEILLRLLGREIRNSAPFILISRIIALAPAAQDIAHSRAELLRILLRDASNWAAGALVDGILQLHPSAQEMEQAREVLLEVLARDTSDLFVAESLRGLEKLAVTTEDRREVRDRLLGLLEQDIAKWGATENPIDAGQLGLAASALAPMIAGLAIGSEERRDTRNTLFRVLSAPASLWAASHVVEGIVQLTPTVGEKRQARDALLTSLTALGSSGHAILMAAQLAAGLAQLSPAPEDQLQARQIIFGLLADTAKSPQDAALLTCELVRSLLQLTPSATDKQQLRRILLTLLTGEINSEEAAGLVDVLMLLGPEAEDKRQAIYVLLQKQARTTHIWIATDLAAAMTRLSPTENDMQEACTKLLALLSRRGPWRTERLTATLIELQATVEHKQEAIKLLLAELAGTTDADQVAEVAEMIAQLDPTTEDRRQVRNCLYDLLIANKTRPGSKRLIGTLIQLAPNDQDIQQTREALLWLLDEQPNYFGLTKELVLGLMQLVPDKQDKDQVRDALLKRLGNGDHEAWELMGATALLNPTTRDLASWERWKVKPTAELLAAVRQNSSLTDWLTTLPSLGQLSDRDPE